MITIAADKLSSAHLKNSGTATDGHSAVLAVSIQEKTDCHLRRLRRNSDVVIQKQKRKCSRKHLGNFRSCVVECRAVVLSGAQLVREKQKRIKRLIIYYDNINKC